MEPPIGLTARARENVPVTRVGELLAMCPVLKNLARPAGGADKGPPGEAAVKSDRVGHVGNVGALDGDFVVVVIAETDGRGPDALGTNAGTGPSDTPVSVDPAQVVDAVVVVTNIRLAKSRIAVAVLETRQSKRTRILRTFRVRLTRRFSRASMASAAGFSELSTGSASLGTSKNMEKSG